LKFSGDFLYYENKPMNEVMKLSVNQLAAGRPD
jgi:hypothetical protein